MIHPLAFISFFILSLFVLPMTTYGQDIFTRQYNFYDNPHTCRGWFCYEDVPESSENTHQEDSIPTTEQTNFSGIIDMEKIWNMPPEELKKLINQALSWAQMAPDDENRMLTYLSLQGVAMRRAKKFQEAWSQALLKYPIFDETVQRSPTPIGTSLEVIAEREDRQKVLNEMRDRMGLLYFYSLSCSYCKKEKEILDSFVYKWSWKNFTAINIHEYPDLAAQYGVMTVPDLWVVGNTSKGILQSRIQSGLADHAAIERGLLTAWYKWFSRGNYERPAMVENIVPFKEFLQSTQEKMILSR